MLRLRELMFYVFAIFYLSSCEYELTELNFKEIEPPPASLSFDLDAIPTDDTIKIFKITNLDFSFNTDGFDLLLAEMTLQDSKWEFNSSSGSLNINPEDYDYGFHKLTLTIYLKSGSGSLADKLSLEGYQITKEWNMVIEGRSLPTIVPTKRINENDFLIFEWPECDRLDFVGYEISYISNLRIGKDTISNRTENYFIDSLYVGGDYIFRVSCIGGDRFQRGQLLTFEEPAPQIYVDELGLDSLRISWDKSPYNAKYRLEIDNQEYIYFNAREDATYTMPQIGLGNSAWFRLCTRSAFQAEWPDPSDYCGITSNTRYSFGDRLISANRPEFGYNYQEKVIYSNIYNDIQVYNSYNLSLLNERRVIDLSYVGLYSCPTNSSKVATIGREDIYIFENLSLSSPIIIPDPRTRLASTDHFILTDNDRLGMASDGKYFLFDINTKELITTIDIDDYPIYSNWASISTSQDAKYMCSVTRNGIKLFQIGAEGEVSDIYSDQRSYRSAYFDPFVPNRLYITLHEDRGIEVRDPRDFSLIDNIDVKESTVIRNIDPETGNILVTDYEFLYILDVETHEEIFRIPCVESKSWLYNNRLFINTGFTLDISEMI